MAMSASTPGTPCNAGGVDPSLTIRNVNGVLAEVLQFPPDLVFGGPDGNIRFVFVFIPGSPGIVEFYSEFLATLQSSLGPGVACVGLSLAGHSVRNLGLGRPPFNLTQQLAHIRAFLAQVHRAQPHARLMLCGHSIGSWLALQALPELEAAKIPVGPAMLLCPILQDHRRPNMG
eukprot:RCo002878